MATGADVSQLHAAVQRWSGQVFTRAVEAMPDRIRPYAPLGETGALRAAVHVQPQPTTAGATMTAGIVADVPQAKFTDQGTRPHIIRPRRSGGVLVFQVPSGATVFARSVNHPGNRARPWWERSLNATWGPSLIYASLTVPFR